MRACLVPGCVAGFADEGTDRVRDLGLLVFRGPERDVALAFDLDLVMGSSEVIATPSAALPQPRPGKTPAGQDPKRAFAASKSPQQHSDQTRKPVKSEQDSCSFDGNHGQSLALSGDPVDQTCGIQQRCCLIEQLLDVEGDFKTLLMKARTGAGIGCAPRGLIKPVSRQFNFAVAAVAGETRSMSALRGEAENKCSN
jgi:hypothetical protein